MSREPEDVRENLSSVVSEVLRDIGVTVDVVKRRREGRLLMETMYDVYRVMINGDLSVYYFGSQSEGTTTRGMKSDIDALFCDHRYNAIQDPSKWKHGVTNVLMIQDNTTAPGYCYLQLMKHDKPLPASHVPDKHHTELNGKVFMKNTINENSLDYFGETVQHGPASNFPEHDTRPDIDRVAAIYCKEWPSEANSWFKRKHRSTWPTKQVIDDVRRSGCFLVPVASKVKGHNKLEWRISTSQAERRLMFSLGITHLGCYILIKLLLKSHINHRCEGVITSFICKTALLHSVEKIPVSLFWQDDNVIHCLNFVLRELYTYVQNKTCPHFIITENNLMANRISDDHQQMLLENIQHIIDSNGKVLFEIQTDDFGARLQRRIHKITHFPAEYPTAEVMHRLVAGKIVYDMACQSISILVTNELSKVNKTHNMQLAMKQVLRYFNRCLGKYTQASQREQTAYKLMLSVLCNTIASLRASEDVSLNRPVSSIALFKFGLISDVSSGWLKLATVYYSNGDINATKSILRRVEQRYDRRRVLPICGCYRRKWFHVKGFDEAGEQVENDAIRHFVSYCVMFMRCERYIVPQEMQQEYSRSTSEQLKQRTINDNYWMDFAVVDSLPYLYFLQYKTYGRLGNREEQRISLDKLKYVVKNDYNLSHKETVFNLIGQCFEIEGLTNEAIDSYNRSLLIRPLNNAAQFLKQRVSALII